MEILLWEKSKEINPTVGATAFYHSGIAQPPWIITIVIHQCILRLFWVWDDS